MLASDGEMVRDVNVAGVTVTVVEVLRLPDAAVIVAVPTATAANRPFAAIGSTGFTIEVLDELQVALVLRSCVELSEYLPVTVNCMLRPSGTFGFAGVTARAVSVAGVTVKRVAALTPPSVAVIVDVPGDTAAAAPLVPAASLTVATVAFDDVQFTEAVKSCTELSEYVPVATSCC
jgi:hypothetical protein